MPSTIRALGDEATARAALPFTVLFPGAMNLGISADGLFAGVTSVALLLLAIGATVLRAGGRPLTGALACGAGGVLLGFVRAGSTANDRKWRRRTKISRQVSVSR